MAKLLLYTGVHNVMSPIKVRVSLIIYGVQTEYVKVASQSLQPSPGSVSSSSRPSRASTPPTEFSSTLSSPTFAPPVETAESIRRRQQSDTASAEIGKRLLKGWAMLAEECPNSRCFGVPLVRPPKAGGGKDSKKVHHNDTLWIARQLNTTTSQECVICHGVYVSERDASGYEHLVALNRTVDEPSQPASAQTSLAGPSGSAGKGKGVIRDPPSPVSIDPVPDNLRNSI